MGARLGHLAATVVLLLAGSSGRCSVPAEQQEARSTTPTTVASSIPEPTPSTLPYADVEAGVRQVAETFARGALAYDASSETAVAFLDRVAQVTTPGALDRLRRSPRAHLDWRALREREERVAVVVTGISVSAAGRVVVRAERTTATSFATVREFVELSLELVLDRGGALKVADAEGGGL